MNRPASPSFLPFRVLNKALENLSVRVRVALLMALGLMLALGLFAGLGWRNVSILLNEDLNRDVTEFTEQVRTELSRGGELQALTFTFPGYEVYSRALTANGQGYEFATFPPEVSALAYSGVIQRQGRWRTLEVSVPWRGQTLRVQSALSSPQLIAGIRAHRNQMFFMAALLVVLGGLSAFLLSLYVMRPLEQLTKASSRIAASGSLLEEVEVPRNAGREVTALAVAFNQMLGRLREFRSREATFNRQASHELRTPLTAMRLSLDAAQAGYTDPQETLEVLDQELRRTQNLTSSLLILAREGHLAQVERVDMAALAQACARQCHQGQGAAQYAGVTEAWVLGDSALLQRALENLLENAAKYAPGSPVQVAVNLVPGGVEVTVQDWGPGLPESELPRLTEEFYRGAQGGAGSGLGLSVVRHVVSAHGGRMSITPVLPHGLNITLRFPAAPPGP